MSSTPTPIESLRAALCTDAWFAQCPADFQQALLDMGRLRHLAAGELLFARGSAPGDLCCVTAGALRVGAVQAEGGESLLACVEPYQWLGEISLIDGQARTHDVTADGPTTVLLVSRDPLQAWLAAHPVHWRSVAQLACSKLRVMFVALEDLAHLPLEQRLARRLWQLAHGYGARNTPPRRKVRLPQEQLALMLGVSRQSVNKALRTLEARGWLALHYGEIELLDLAALGQGLGQGGASHTAG